MTATPFAGLRPGKRTFRRRRHGFRWRPRLEGLEARLTPTSLPDGFSETLVADGLDSPTAMAQAPDGRIFVDQQGGDVRVIKDGALLPTPFLHLDVDSTGERGLLGLAFDPDFADNQYVYFYYTVPGSPAHNRVSRFTADGDVADPASEYVLLDLDNLSDAIYHNGGSLHFGLDGALYIGVGENTNADNSQDPSNLLGKILRINPDGSIPADNPFVGVEGYRPEIWALGFRNPYTFAVQPGTGRIFVNDVGSSPPAAREEINDLQPGGNYGWPIYEGYSNDPNYVSPLYAYPSGVTDPDTGAFVCAIVGGTFYNPDNQQFPADYAGTYFFSDLCGNWIKQLNPDTGDVTVFATGTAGDKVDLLVDSNGSLDYLSLDDGAVYRIDYTGSHARSDGLARDPAFASLAPGFLPGLTGEGRFGPVPVVALGMVSSQAARPPEYAGAADPLVAGSLGGAPPAVAAVWKHAPAPLAEDRLDFLFADPLAG
jgi:glucose/arabinose dehydrogenase